MGMIVLALYIILDCVYMSFHKLVFCFLLGGKGEWGLPGVRLWYSF